MSDIGFWKQTQFRKKGAFKLTHAIWLMGLGRRNVVKGNSKFGCQQWTTWSTEPDSKRNSRESTEQILIDAIGALCDIQRRWGFGSSLFFAPCGSKTLEKKQMVKASGTSLALSHIVAIKQRILARRKKIDAIWTKRYRDCSFVMGSPTSKANGIILKSYEVQTIPQQSSRR